MQRYWKVALFCLMSVISYIILAINVYLHGNALSETNLRVCLGYSDSNHSGYYSTYHLDLLVNVMGWHLNSWDRIRESWVNVNVHFFFPPYKKTKEETQNTLFLTCVFVAQVLHTLCRWNVPTRIVKKQTYSMCGFCGIAYFVNKWNNIK